MGERGMHPEGQEQQSGHERANTDAYAELASELVSYLETHPFSKDDEELKALLQKKKKLEEALRFSDYARKHPPAQRAKIHDRYKEIPKAPTLEDYRHAIALQKQWLSQMSSVSRGHQLYEWFRLLEGEARKHATEIARALVLNEDHLDVYHRTIAWKDTYPDAVPGTVVEHEGERYILTESTFLKARGGGGWERSTALFWEKLKS